MISILLRILSHSYLLIIPLLLLEVCFFKQKITSKQIVCFLFSALPLAILIEMSIIDIGDDEGFFYFIILFLSLVMFVMLCVYARIKDSVLKNIVAIFILVALSTLSILATMVLLLLASFSIFGFV